MKTFKKILFGAGILFNSCAIVAMDNETDNQVSTESAKTTEKMNLLKTKDLKINQQNDIRTLLLKALDENGRLKSESLSRDEQDAVDLINAIQANKEPRNSLFYQNIEKIAKINSAASTTKNAPPLVLSVSWGASDSFFSTSYMTSANDQAKILSAMGVTLIAASGDDGALGYFDCTYTTYYPASSPYFTTVGATNVLLK